MAHFNSATLPASARHTGATPSLLRRIFRIEALWRSRQQLATLDAAQMDDIGVSRQSAAQEAAKAPWDVPAHWTK